MGFRFIQPFQISGQSHGGGALDSIVSYNFLERIVNIAETKNNYDIYQPKIELTNLKTIFQNIQKIWLEHSNISYTIITKYLKPFEPKNTKPKTPSQQKKSDEQKAELNAAIQNMLDDEFLGEILSYTMSKEEAQMRISQFLNS